MRVKIYLFFLLNFFAFGTSLAQYQNTLPVDTPFFNYAYWNGVADKMHYSAAERAELLAGQKKFLIDEMNHQHIKEEDLIWVTNGPSAPPQNSKKYGSNTVNAGPCTNIDFELGTFAGWTRRTGFNPLIPGIGCCPNPNGDQTIVSGAGVDPYGGFPVVYPGGGNFSLRLGSNAIGGIADRIEQTFFVTPGNANFTYRYAVVLNDGGHTLTQQPKFTSEIIDTLGQPVNCTFYQVSAGSGVTGFSTSASTANGPIIYKNWTNVAIDLSPNIGQNVTLRFTVMDCSPTGHFAYAYIDGLCTNFATSIADTTCPNVPIGICAPAGFSTTTWNGPGILNDPNQCINVTIPGVYTCTTLLVPGCPGPTFTHTLTTLPPPIVSFTPVTTGPCAPQYTFNQSMSITGGAITSHTWSFGDGSTSTATNPVHSYAAPGNYPVKLRAISNRGCLDSVINFITVFPFPNLVFSPPSNCINTVVQFTNTSSISVGSITSYTWDLGNGNPTNNLVNPTEIYGTNGTYTITLSATSNQGCISLLTQTLGIFPPPIISFSANPLCDINGTSFAPATSTAIASGNLAIYNWDFGDGQTSNLPNPVHIYTTSGTYVVNFNALSNHNCPASVTQTLTISPSPTVAFSTTSINACSPNFTFTNNSGISVGPISYTWSFGGTNTTTATSPSYTFPSIGNYTVRLIGSSNMGCLDTALQFISVYPYPIINFSVPASCENAIFTVSTTAVSGSVTSYAWDFGDPSSGASNFSNVQSPTHYFSTTNVYTLNLNIISNLNCASHYSTLVTVYPNPVAAFSYSTANNCSLPFAYVNSSTVSNIGASVLSAYKWDFGPAGTSTVANPGTVIFPGNGSYSVSLIAITNHNCSDTTSFNILVHPLPAVDFSVNPTCLNKPTSYSVSSSISPVPIATSSIVSYIFNYGDGFFTNSVTPAPHTYSSNGTYTLAYSATSNMGCVASAIKTHTIHAVPSLNFTTTSNMCLGFPTQFTSTSSIPAGTIFALNWDFGDGSPFGANASTAHTYTASNVYNVKFFAITNNECSDTVTKPVAVHPLPVVSFTANGGCLNTLTFFNDTSSVTGPNPNFISSYNWNFGDGNFSTQQKPTHTYTNYATHNPSLTVTSNHGCATTVSNTLTIHPLPNISFSPPGACVNSAIQFTNTSSIPFGSITNYVWDFSDGSGTLTATQPLHTFTVPGVYVVTVSATSNQGCVRTATNDLSIYPYPSVSLTPINSACINDMVAIYPNVSITGSNNPISGYTVSYGDGSPAFTATSALQFTLQHLYTAYNTYTVTLTATSNGCSTNTSTIVKVYPKPFTNFVPSNFCLNDLTQFANTSSIAATYSIQQHTWDFGDGAVPQSTVQNASHVFSGPGQFSVTLTEYTFPEVGLTCSVSAVKVITINPIPATAFVTNSVCAGVATSFTNNTPPTTASQTVTGWSWYFHNNGQLNAAGQSPAFTYSASGTYTALLTALNNFGCSNSFTSQVNVWANPVVSFSVNNVCRQAPSTFTESTTIVQPLVNSLATWAWQFGDGSAPSYSNTQNPSHTYSLYGTYYPTLTVTSNKGCSTILTGSTIVHPLPIVAFSPPGACENSVVQFTNTSTIPLGSIVSYVWDFNDSSPTSTLTNPSHLYVAPKTYSVNLIAVSNQGCIRNATSNIVISPNPTIQITTLGSKCINDFVVISPVVLISGAGNVISGYTVSFGDGSPAFTTTTPLQYTVGHHYAGPNTYSIDISAISNGCIAKQSASINVYPKPFVSFTATKFCLNDPTVFVNTSTISSVGAITGFDWNFDDGGSTSTSVSPTYMFLGVGVHNVSLTANTDPEPGSGLNCSVTAVKSITINPLPLMLPFSTNSVCLGNSTQFTNPSPTTGVTGWSWLTNGQLFSVANNPSYTYTNSGKFPAMLVGVNSFGCRDTLIDTVKVYAPPTASFVTNNACFGDQNLFVDKSVAVEGGLTTFTWNTNGNPGFSNAQNPTFVYGQPGTYTVQLATESIFGCIGKYTTTLSVFALPNINFSVSETCQDVPAQFINLSSINNGTISSFLWTFNNPAAGSNSLSSLVNPTHLFPGSGSFATTLEAVSDNNCRATPKIMNVIIHTKPTANFSNGLICAGDKSTLANSSNIVGGTIVNSLWDFNGDNIVDQDAYTPNHTYSLSGNYMTRLIAITDHGCSDTATKQIYANPKAVAAITSNFRSGCPTLCINFKDASTIAPGSTIVTTTWDFGDGSLPQTAVNAGNCYKEPGLYDVGLHLVTDVGCVTDFVYPGYVSVSLPPSAGFKVEPELIDEDEPVVNISNEASPDATSIKYYISDGSNYGTPGFTHYIKNLKSTKPMVVQIVKNASGCADTLYKVLEIKPSYVIFFPNVFTPNGDGTNDDFRPKGVGIVKFNMNIYDRWGHQVFQTNDMTETWDGSSKNADTSVKEDTYTWKAQVTDIFNKTHFLVGHVTVIR